MSTTVGVLNVSVMHGCGTCTIYRYEDTTVAVRALNAEVAQLNQTAKAAKGDKVPALCLEMIKVRTMSSPLHGVPCQWSACVAWMQVQCVYAAAVCVACLEVRSHPVERCLGWAGAGV